ncbi:MAG: 50S ribosomal protein L30e [Methanocellales archaeon]
MELNRALQTAIKTGNVKIGSRETIKVALKGEAKLVILAKNCPVKIRNQLKELKLPIYEYPGQSPDLGLACGLPYTITALAIIEPGESEILSLLRGA